MKMNSYIVTRNNINLKPCQVHFNGPFSIGLLVGTFTSAFRRDLQNFFDGSLPASFSTVDVLSNESLSRMPSGESLWQNEAKGGLNH
jgi:hypothetical protein